MHGVPSNTRHGIIEASFDRAHRTWVGMKVEQLKAAAPDDGARMREPQDERVHAIHRQRAASAPAGAQAASCQGQHRLVPRLALGEPIYDVYPGVHGAFRGSRPN